MSDSQKISIELPEGFEVPPLYSHIDLDGDVVLEWIFPQSNTRIVVTLCKDGSKYWCVVNREFSANGVIEEREDNDREG